MYYRKRLKKYTINERERERERERGGGSDASFGAWCSLSQRFEVEFDTFDLVR